MSDTREQSSDAATIIQAHARGKWNRIRISTMLTQAVRMYEPRRRVASMLNADPALRERNHAKWGKASNTLEEAGTLKDIKSSVELRNSVHKARWATASSMFLAAGNMQGIRSSVELRNSVQKAREQSITTVGTAADLERIPFWQQGDESLNTEAILAVRARIRRHQKVVNELQLWWVAAQRSMRQSHGKAYEASKLSRDEYIRISRLLSKVLLESYDADEAQQCAEEDFEADAGGGDTISREQFMDGIYELADVYTRTVEVQEYVEFLQTLFERITINKGGKYFWKAESAVVYGGYEEEEEEETHKDSSEEKPLLPRKARVSSPPEQPRRARVSSPPEQPKQAKSSKNTSKNTSKNAGKDANKDGKDSKKPESGLVSDSGDVNARIFISVPVSKRGIFGSVLKLDVGDLNSLTVGELKSRAAAELKVNASELELSLKSGVLNDSTLTLSDAGLRNGAKVSASLVGDDGNRRRVGAENDYDVGDNEGSRSRTQEPIWLYNDGSIDHTGDDGKLVMDWGSIEEKKTHEYDGPAFRTGGNSSDHKQWVPEAQPRNEKATTEGVRQSKEEGTTRRERHAEPIAEAKQHPQEAVVRSEEDEAQRAEKAQRMRPKMGSINSMGTRWKQARSVIDKQDGLVLPNLRALKKLSEVLPEAAAEKMVTKLPSKKLEWVTKVVDTYGASNPQPQVVSKLPKVNAAARASVHASGAVTAREPRPQAPTRPLPPQTARPTAPGPRSLRTGGVHTTRIRKRGSPSKVLQEISYLPPPFAEIRYHAPPKVRQRVVPPSRIGQGSFAYIANGQMGLRTPAAPFKVDL